MRELYIKTEGSEPVTVAQLKDFVNYLGSDSDYESMIETIGKAARLRLEQYTGRNFVEKTMVLNTDSPTYRMELPFGPVRDIVSVKAYDEDGVLDETLTADDDYFLLGDFDKIMKLESFNTGGYIAIEYRAGYGDNTFDLPDAMTQAIKRQVKYDFDRRGNVENETIAPEVKMMLDPYKKMFI